jgi:hypothetical protein
VQLCHTRDARGKLKNLVAQKAVGYTQGKDNRGLRAMTYITMLRAGCTGTILLALAACGGGSIGSGLGSGDSGLFDRGNNPTAPDAESQFIEDRPQRQSSVFDLFANVDDPNDTVEVNKYLWNASLDVLSFLPVQSVDPFSGVIVMGYGTPPGGGRSYRATIFVSDPALDARSLKVALATRGGPVSADTQRAVEDAILTRARQLRIRDRDL